MPAFEPFPGLRYADSDSMGDLACPPYDVISPEDQTELHRRHPHNAVHLELAAAGEGDDPYRRARATFEDWMTAGVLVADDPSFYVYRQDFTASDGTRRRVAGVVGALGLEPFGSDAGVLPHERTMAGPKADRMALLATLGVNISPIYAIYRGGGGLAPFFSSLEARPPQIRFADGDRVLHRMWVISAPAEVAVLRDAIAPGPLVIADGHHRYETALEYHGQHGGEGSGAIMCFAVDADAEELVVLPYHRLIRSSGPPDAAAFAGASPCDPHGAQAALAAAGYDHPFAVVTARGCLVIGVSDDDVVGAVGPRAPAWRELDVVALHEVVLPRLFPSGIDEMRFTKDAGELARLVDEGWTAGILLRAIAPPGVVDVATTGERMPQKASYFWPKAATGLVFRSLR